MSENKRLQNGSSNGKTHSNGNSGNGHSSDLKNFIKNREERMMEIYGRDWTPDEIQELREKIERANARANEIRKEWGLI